MKQFRNKWHLNEFSNNIHFYTVSAKSYISTQNEAAGDISGTWEKTQIYSHKFNPSGLKNEGHEEYEEYFLIMCVICSSLCT